MLMELTFLAWGGGVLIKKQINEKENCQTATSAMQGIEIRGQESDRWPLILTDHGRSL